MASRQTKSKPTNLTINAKTDLLVTKAEDTPPPQSSPMNLEGIDLSSFGGDFSAPLDITLRSLPQSPPKSPRVVEPERNGSKTFLTNFKSRLTSEQDQRAEQTTATTARKGVGVKDDEEYRPSSSSMSKIYHLRKNPGSTPELSLVGSAEGERKQSDDAIPIVQSPETKPLPPPRPQEDASSTARRRDKSFKIPLTRQKSQRKDSNTNLKQPTKQSFDNPPKTAPLKSDWQASSEMLLKPRGGIGKPKRGKSAERAIASESEDNLPLSDRKESKDSRHAFVTGSKSVMSKAKTGGGNLLNRLGKLGRSGSHNEKELPDSEYVIKVINLPLIEQTRITRISKDLGSCRDKTEFWMPSLPWRCIDYLNLNCESEGLYRVPGSGPQVKHWQRRFDTELDLDLLDEEELYDPNIISSMLKSWLRDLPTEIMPKVQQQQLANDLEKDNSNYQKMGEPAPQRLRDALSELPPFNYYLLFAITCHLSLLLSHKDKNKMDLNNLSICIGPCLDLERWLFNYLVGDWRRCWQGCFTEKQFLEAEKAYEGGSEYEMPIAVEREQEQPFPVRSQSAPQQDVTPPMMLDEKPPSQTAVSINSKSRQTSHDADEDEDNGTTSPPLPPKDDITPMTSPPLPPKPENVKPENSITSLPDYSHYINGSVPPTPEQSRKASVFAKDEEKRPSTAEGVESPRIGTSNGAKGKSSRLAMHQRSQSDLAVTSSPAVGGGGEGGMARLEPVKSMSPIEFDFEGKKEGS